jgi:putative membrane protein
LKENPVAREVGQYFSKAERDEIRRAVDEAEKGTSGEIVPYVVEASDNYEGSLWKGAALGGLIGAVAGIAWEFGFESWGGLGRLLPLTLPVLGAALGYLLCLLSATVRRAMVSREVLETRVRRRAAVAFLDEELFRTRDRTGILIYLSLFEHRVVVLADEGINSQVREEEWSELTGDLAEGIRQGRAGSALVEAIGRCGDLLAERGVKIRPDDENELGDDLRLHDR